MIESCLLLCAVLPKTPTIEIVPDDTVEDGANFTLNCTTESDLASQSTVIFWKGSDLLAVVQRSNSTVTITAVAHIHDQKNYTCQVSADDLGTNSSSSQPVAPRSKLSIH